MLNRSHQSTEYFEVPAGIPETVSNRHLVLAIWLSRQVLVLNIECSGIVSFQHENLLLDQTPCNALIC